MALCPETPVWLMWNGLLLPATKSLRQLHGPHFAPERHPRLREAAGAAVAAAPRGQRTAEPLLSQHAACSDAGAAGAAGEAGGFGALLAPRYRRVMVLAAALPLLQQASGINTIVFFSTQASSINPQDVCHACQHGPRARSPAPVGGSLQQGAGVPPRRYS